MSWRKVETPGEYGGVNVSSEIVVQTNDKAEYILPRSATTLSKLLNDLLQDNEGEESTTVPLANVDANTFGMQLFEVQNSGTALQEPV